MAIRHVNAVVVGAGAGGGVVAKELSEAGLTVVLFERRRWYSFDDHDNDELNSQRTTVLGAAYGPDKRHPRVITSWDGSWKVVLPHEGGYHNLAACVGGGTLSYGAMAWRFMPQDFAMRTEYGAVEGSTLEDWPISYYYSARSHAGSPRKSERTKTRNRVRLRLSRLFSCFRSFAFSWSEIVPRTLRVSWRKLLFENCLRCENGGT